MLFDIEWYYWVFSAIGLFFFILTIRADLQDAKAKKKLRHDGN